MLKNNFNTAWRNLMKYRRSNQALEFLKSTYVNFTWWMLLIPCMMAICIAIMTVFAQAMTAAMANPVNSLRSE
jgi:heme/copper-type cytochrome/quinol oxidase subunit 2